jgi:tRNA-modifying protein YgfZ
MPINISTHPGIFTWQPAAWLRVTGEDAATFLQGQFTNDLRDAATKGAVYGLWLNLKGKVLADSFVLRGTDPNEFWIGSYFSSAAVIRERLESHIIADDVTVEDQTSAWVALTRFEEGALRRAAATTPGQAFIFPGRRDRSEHSEYVYRVGAVEPEHAVGAVRLNSDEMARRRIVAGIPAIPGDVGPADLPNEAGLEADAISYTKGCYLGQEVMARLKSMGQVRRRLLRVSGESAVPSTPAPVFVGPRQVGEVRSAVSDRANGWVGLAMLSLLHVKTGTLLALAADAAPTVHVTDPL